MQVLITLSLKYQQTSLFVSISLLSGLSVEKENVIQSVSHSGPHGTLHGLGPEPLSKQECVWKLKTCFHGGCLEIKAHGSMASNDDAEQRSFFHFCVEHTDSRLQWFQERKCCFDISILYILRSFLPLDITVVMLEFTVVTVNNGQSEVWLACLSSSGILMLEWQTGTWWLLGLWWRGLFLAHLWQFWELLEITLRKVYDPAVFVN